MQQNGLSNHMIKDLIQQTKNDVIRQQFEQIIASPEFKQKNYGGVKVDLDGNKSESEIVTIKKLLDDVTAKYNAPSNFAGVGKLAFDEIYKQSSGKKDPTSTTTPLADRMIPLIMQMLIDNENGKQPQNNAGSLTNESQSRGDIDDDPRRERAEKWLSGRHIESEIPSEEEYDAFIDPNIPKTDRERSIIERVHKDMSVQTGEDDDGDDEAIEGLDPETNIPVITIDNTPAKPAVISLLPRGTKPEDSRKGTRVNTPISKKTINAHIDSVMRNDLEVNRKIVDEDTLKGSMYDFDETGLDKIPVNLNKHQRVEYDRLMEDRNKYQFDEFNNPRFDPKEPIKRHQLYNAYLYADHMTQTAKNKVQKHVKNAVEYIKNILDLPKDSAEPLNESLEEIRIRNKNKPRRPPVTAISEDIKTEVQNSNNLKEPEEFIPDVDALQRDEVIHELVREASDEYAHKHQGFVDVDEPKANYADEKEMFKWGEKVQTIPKFKIKINNRDDYNMYLANYLQELYNYYDTNKFKTKHTLDQE
jgi:hypothetical protein